MVSRKVTIWKFKMLYFRNERHHRTGNLKNYLFLGHLQPPLDKNSKDLAILILEFDDITVKTIYCFLSSLEWESRRRSSWGSSFVHVLSLHAQDLLKAPFNSTHKPSLNCKHTL